MTAWVVKLGNRTIDTVFFGPTMEPRAIRETLIKHHRMDARIRVARA